MKLIKDLGTSKTETGRRVRYGVYLCPNCIKEVVVNQYDVRRRRGNKVCYSCSQRANGSKHGESGTRLHRIWTNIKQRTTNKKNKDYARYGGRGIVMFQGWFHTFALFSKWSKENNYNEMFEIHRRDNNKGYSPTNCVWLSKEDHLDIHKRYDTSGTIKFS